MSRIVETLINTREQKKFSLALKEFSERRKTILKEGEIEQWDEGPDRIMYEKVTRDGNETMRAKWLYRLRVVLLGIAALVFYFGTKGYGKMLFLIATVPYAAFIILSQYTVEKRMFIRRRQLVPLALNAIAASRSSAQSEIDRLMSVSPAQLVEGQGVLASSKKLSAYQGLVSLLDEEAEFLSNL